MSKFDKIIDWNKGPGNTTFRNQRTLYQRVPQSRNASTILQFIKECLPVGMHTLVYGLWNGSEIIYWEGLDDEWFYDQFNISKKKIILSKQNELQTRKRRNFTYLRVVEQIH